MAARDIVQTKAYSNSFFETAGRFVEHERVADFIREWFPVTQTFCLALPGYTGLFAGEVARSSGRRREELEKGMLVLLSIAGGEFGMGLHGLGGIHYRMFARLGDPFGISLDELRRNPYGTFPATKRLVDGIQDALSDLYLGAGCIRVVEGTAYNIVQAMNLLFRPLNGAAGGPFYTKSQLEYIDLHLELEKEHDNMAADVVAVLSDSKEHSERIGEAVHSMCDLFGSYWEKMAEHTFGGTPTGLLVDA